MKNIIPVGLIKNIKAYINPAKNGYILFSDLLMYHLVNTINNKKENAVRGKSIKYVVLWFIIMGLNVKIKAAHIPVSFSLIILQNS